MENYIQVHQYLQKFDIKPSVQRTAVMNYLMQYKTHPTIDEIYNALTTSMPTLSKTTIYNTLDLFVEKGAVLQLRIDEKNARYDADVKDHAHFFCTSCGKVYDIFDLEPEKFESPSIDGFQVQTVEISYSGICGNCNSTN